MLDLFSAYPELWARIDALCHGEPWAVTGVSALVCGGETCFFEITKPKHWVRQGTRIGAQIGGIGGSLEPGETILSCLQRELGEELCVTADPVSAPETHLVFDERWAGSLTLAERGYPAPVLLTISENITRRDVLPEARTLAIVTFGVRLRGEPSLGDLYGLLAVPRSAVRDALAPDRTTLSRLGALGARWITREPLPPNLSLTTVWTARSLQVLLHSERF